LRQAWLPVLFAEENPIVGSLADLYLTIVAQIGESDGDVLASRIATVLANEGASARVGGEHGFELAEQALDRAAEAAGGDCCC